MPWVLMFGLMTISRESVTIINFYYSNYYYFYSEFG
jgi:hypothetical protein